MDRMPIYRLDGPHTDAGVLVMAAEQVFDITDNFAFLSARADSPRQFLSEKPNAARPEVGALLQTSISDHSELPEAVYAQTVAT